ncbi:proton-conducting membrane transporter [Iocasia frigidifontis]|uniref:Proton-conducting membrane transporter n=1 Tax=Iocasia fonsfrigidae TaxID=2682810 RepID=A0A8A7KC34_9FIRM|nr:4Fe-4S dicluster domain-containing protein [Iocasia fonsfrigidae]QTL98800.1 proton-conducting membrane transporter [Iocasia fonsfrigidae]
MGLIDKIFEAGVVGAGGAGFPTHLKYDCKTEYLIINGAECEPLLQTDKFLMRTFPEEIITALKEVAYILGVEKIFFALKEKYKREILALQRVVTETKANIEFFLMDSFYPAGDEQILVYEITGRTVPEGGIPLQVGAVVTNVGTLYNVYQALQDKVIIEKYVSVLGEVKKPRIVKVPIGTLITECIRAAGESVLEDYAVIIGGPMMGKKLTEKKEIEKAVISKTDGAVIVLPKDHYVIQRSQQEIEHIKSQAKAACIQCRSCTELCPRFLIGHHLEPHRIMRALVYSESVEIFKLAQLCCECGVCELYACPMGLSPRRVNSYLKNKIAEKYDGGRGDYSSHLMREYRKIPTERQVSRLNLAKYEHQLLEEKIDIRVMEVKIPLDQHIGVPAELVVKEGQIVKKGDLIGKAVNNALSANIHASLSGVVVSANQKEVIISKSSGGVL